MVEFSEHFSFAQVRPNNYSTFYDDQRQNWSIRFESEKAAVEFLKQVTPYHIYCVTIPREMFGFPLISETPCCIC